MTFPCCTRFKRFLATVFLLSLFCSLTGWSALTPLVEHENDWRYRKGTNEPPADWHSVADAALDDSWLTGPGGFGYGDGDDATVLSDMQNNYNTVYTRQSFEVTEPPPETARLRLSVDYDDGYVAYLDGVEVARSPNVPSTPHPYNSDLPSDSPASVDGGAIDVADLGLASGLLGVGTHILAVQGINGDAPSSDLSLIVDLDLDDTIVLPPTNEISGTLLMDTTLYSSNAIYTVTGDLLVEEGVTLTIEPGVTVRFDSGTGLTVFGGRLLAEGTEAEPITFTRRSDTGTWERILLIETDPSVLRHCIVEYSDCEGDHKDYYDNDGNPDTPPLPRTYFQAVVVLAGHLDIEHCLFRNLPNASGSAQGDAIAIISDDLDHPGFASATIRNSDFIGIGQAIHTRFAHVLVEGCFFTTHNGDNDDIDLYGESMPPSLIVNNRFLDPDSDDAINPTRSSAIMIGNVVGHTGGARSGDSGVVLRDRCCPVMINNLIFNINRNGIDVQNTCDALLINNTIVNCGTGINFFDHVTRYDFPYFLTPGAASATSINNLIWDCGTSFRLIDSASANMPGSVANVIHCNVQGGQAATSVSANSTLNWGPGNIDADPLLASAAANDYHILAGSACIDAGTNVNATVTLTNRSGAVLTNLTFTVTSDLDGVPRPLDGDGDGSALHDIGAYEFLLATADSNGDTVPDGWYFGFGLDPTDPGVGVVNHDGDGHRTIEEWIADTDPTDGESFFQVESVSLGNPVVIQYRTSANRRYTLYYAEDLGDGSGGSVLWTPVPGQSDVAGSGGMDMLTDAEAAEVRYYKIGVALP